MRTLRRTPVIIALAAILVLLTSGSALAQYSFDWTFDKQGAIKDSQSFEDFLTHFTNTSALTDSFRVTMVTDMPSSWTATLCEGPLCYPPYYTVHIFDLDPGESTNLDFAIWPNQVEGKGTSTVTIESLSNPAVVQTNSFSVITSGLDVLTVDADGGADYQTFFMDAITAAGRTTADWTRSYMGTLTEADLANFTAVVWLAGTNSLSLNDEDRFALADYVYNDGNFFLSGQNLATDYCSPGSPQYSPLAHAWFQDLLGVDYQGDDAATSTIDGVAEDPVSDGMTFSINGGDGADNNTSPDEVIALSNGATSLVYSTGPAAGIRGAYGD